VDHLVAARGTNVLLVNIWIPSRWAAGGPIPSDLAVTVLDAVRSLSFQQVRYIMTNGPSAMIATALMDDRMSTNRPFGQETAQQVEAPAFGVHQRKVQRKLDVS